MHSSDCCSSCRWRCELPHCHSAGRPWYQPRSIVLSLVQALTWADQPLASTSNVAVAVGIASAEYNNHVSAQANGCWPLLNGFTSS